MAEGFKIADAYIEVVTKDSTSTGTSAIKTKLKTEGGKAGDEAGKETGSRFANAMSSPVGKITALLGGAFAADKVTSFFQESVAEARESQKVTAQTEAVIKSTGGSAKVTAGQIGDLANSISLKTGIDDEAIQSGENMLLTFTNIRNEVGKGNDVFTQATKVNTDMAVAMGTDASTNAIMLGKALNDPIKGITALTRVGVSFTDEQKAQIEQMVKVGDTAGAQKIIIGELNKEFGGSAEAQATAGDKAAVAWGNLKETLGNVLLPVIDKVANFITTTLVPAITSMVEWIGNNSAVIGPLAAILGVLLAGILAVVGAIRVWTIVQGVFNTIMSANPIGLVVIAIAALVAGVIYAYTHFKTFHDIVNNVFTVLKTVVTTAVNVIKTVITTAWNAISAVTTTVFNAIKTGITTYFNFYKSIITTAVNVIKTVVSTAFNLVKTYIINPISSAYSSVSSIIGKIVSVFSGLGSKLASALKSVVNVITAPFRSAFNGIASLWNNTVGRISFSIPSWVPIIGGNSFSVPRIPTFAKGGLLTGAGTGTSDSILAMLSNGEYVQNAAAVNYYGPKLMEAMNGRRIARSVLYNAIGGQELQTKGPFYGSLHTGNTLPGYATGGYVVSNTVDLQALLNAGVPISQISYSGSTLPGYTAPTGLSTYSGTDAVYVGEAGTTAPDGATTLVGSDRYATASLVSGYVSSSAAVATTASIPTAAATLDRFADPEYNADFNQSVSDAIIKGFTDAQNNGTLGGGSGTETINGDVFHIGSMALTIDAATLDEVNSVLDLFNQISQQARAEVGASA